MLAVAAGAPVRPVEQLTVPVAAAPQDAGFALALDTAISQMAVPGAASPVGGASIAALAATPADGVTTTERAAGPAVATIPSVSSTTVAAPTSATPIAAPAIAGDPNEMPRPDPLKLEQGAQTNVIGKDQIAERASASGPTEKALETPKARLASPKRLASALPATIESQEPADTTAPSLLPALAAATTASVALPTAGQTMPTRAGETKISRTIKSASDRGATEDLAVRVTARDATPMPAAITSQLAPTAEVAAPPEMPSAAAASPSPSSASALPAARPAGPAPTSALTAGAQVAEASSDRNASPTLESTSASPFALSLPGQVTHASRPIPTSADTPTVKAQPGQLGHEVGVQIARRVAAGGDELIVRLDPPTLGRIEVRMTFDDRASLRAVFTADSAPALDMLRRDGADLTRALSDAGIRSDAQSLRFDTRGGDSGGQQRHAWHKPDNRSGPFAGNEPAADTAELAYRNVRTSGRYDLMA